MQLPINLAWTIATYIVYRTYANTLCTLVTPAHGFTAIKFGWGPMGDDEETDVGLVREARRGAGEQVDILIDAGQVWDWKTALRRAHQFAEFRPFWLEEPLHPQDVEGYGRLSAGSPIPIAAGDGYVHAPERPGLGVTVDENVMRRFLVE